MPKANEQGPIRGAVLVCLMMGMLDQALGAEYFVAPSGSDANAGMLLAPFKTIQRAASIMITGDTSHVRAGT